MAQRTAVQVAVLGGGVVGCAVARQLAKRGKDVMLLEQSVVGSGVSAGNTGIACTMLGVPKDSLEHRCLSRALPRNVPTYRALGVPHRETGALYVAWTDEEAEALETLERSTEEVDLQRLSPEELKDMEPALSPSLGGVLVPGEVTVDPGLVVLAFAAEAHSLGAQIREHCEVSFAGRYGEAWLLQLPDETLLAEQVVSCTGLSAALWDFSELWFQPRRGDYLLFQRPSPHSLAPLGRPIGAVPTPHARGVYVWPTVHGDVLCGPTNVPQADQLLPKPSDATLDALRRKAISVCPALAGWPVAGSYAGLRPALADTFGTDYLLNSSKNWTSISGVRSTGLTASLGIAQEVLERLTNAADGRLPDESPEGSAFRLPSLEQLAETYASSGCVEAAQRRWYVAHPQTALGLATTAQTPWMPGHVSRSGSAWWATSYDAGAPLRSKRSELSAQQAPSELSWTVPLRRVV